MPILTIPFIQLWAIMIPKSTPHFPTISCANRLRISQGGSKDFWKSFNWHHHSISLVLPKTSMFTCTMILALLTTHSTSSMVLGVQMEKVLNPPKHRASLLKYQADCFWLPPQCYGCSLAVLELAEDSWDGWVISLCLWTCWDVYIFVDRTFTFKKLYTVHVESQEQQTQFENFSELHFNNVVGWEAMVVAWEGDQDLPNPYMVTNPVKNPYQSSPLYNTDSTSQVSWRPMSSLCWLNMKQNSQLIELPPFIIQSVWVLLLLVASIFRIKCTYIYIDSIPNPNLLILTDNN